MKYCLSGRQSKIYLNKADEILVESRDYRYISDLIVEYPGKTIILDVPKDKFEELKQAITEYGKIDTVNFVCKIYDLNPDIIEFFHFIGVKFYYGYSVNSFYDVQGLINLGVEYVQIHAPLTFNIDALKLIKTKFRMVPNVAYDAYVPRREGICGQWVRPEDVKWYEDGIYVFEFEDCNLEKERTLYDIYAEKGTWPGNLNLLITNLNVDADNRGLPEDFGQARSNCHQRCMEVGVCHYCQSAFTFEKYMRNNRDEIKEYIATQKEKN